MAPSKYHTQQEFPPICGRPVHETGAADSARRRSALWGHEDDLSIRIGRIPPRAPATRAGAERGAQRMPMISPGRLLGSIARPEGRSDQKVSFRRYSLVRSRAILMSLSSTML